MAQEQDTFQVQVNLNYISDPQAIIKYSPQFGGIYQGSFSTVVLDWTAQTDMGLTGYNVYYGVHPITHYKANTDAIISTNHYEFQLPLYPQNIINYFWVSKVVGGTETILNPEGYSSYYAAEQQNIYGENPIFSNSYFPETDNIFASNQDAWEKAKAEKLMILQMFGVKCDVYFRKWGTIAPYGQMCACVEDTQDPSFLGSGRCALCFGTGLIGGYYEPLEMFIRFPNKPASNFQGTIKGLTLSQTWDAWTMAPPFLRDGDLVVRKVDGRRFIVKGVQLSSWAGAASMQNFNLDLLQQTDIRQIVSTSTIRSAMANLSDPRYNPGNRQEI